MAATASDRSGGLSSRVGADLLHFELDRWDLGRGIRVALPLAIALSLGFALGELEAGALVALGSFLLSFSETDRPYGARLLSLLIVSGVDAIAVAAGTLVPLAGTAQYPLLGLAVFLIAFAGIYREGAPFEICASILLFIGLGLGNPGVMVASERLLLVLLGGFFTTAVAALLWRWPTFDPARSALSRAYRRLARLARESVNLHPLRAPREDPDASLNEAEALGARENPALGPLVDCAWAIRSELLLTGGGPPRRAAGLAALGREPLIAAARELETVAAGMRLARFGARSSYGSSRWTEVAARAASVRDSLAASGAEESAPAPAFTPTPRPRPNPTQASGLLTPIRRNLSGRSELLRAAVGLGIATVAAALISSEIGAQRGYWMLITLVVILRPGLEATAARSALRTAGTIAGVGVALAVALTVPDGWLLVPSIFALGVLTFATRTVHYGIFVIFLTPLILVLVDLPSAPTLALAADRIIDTIVGAALALATGAALWATWPGRTIGAGPSVAQPAE